MMEQTRGAGSQAASATFLFLLLNGPLISAFSQVCEEFSPRGSGQETTERPSTCKLKLFITDFGQMLHKSSKVEDLFCLLPTGTDIPEKLLFLKTADFELRQAAVMNVQECS